MSDIGEFILNFVLALFVLFMGAVLFVMTPRALYVDAKCLDAGFPTSTIAWNLKGYCIALDGSTRTLVEELR